MFNKSHKSHKGLFTAVILLLIILGLGTWAVLRGSLFFNRQLKTQPTDHNLVRLWKLQDYDAILSLTETTLYENPMEPYSLIFSGFAGYHKAISQISVDDVDIYLNDAILKLRKSLILEDIPKKELIYYILGKSYLYKGEFFADLAVKYLQMALEAGYENEDSYEFLGEAWSYLGNYEKSISCYETALKKFKSDRLYLKIAEDSFLFGRYNKAAEYYSILISRTRDASLKKKGLFQLGKLYYDIKNLTKSKETLLTLTELDPTVAEAWFLLGEISFLKEDNREARSYWHQTLRIDPEHRAARLRLYN